MSGLGIGFDPMEEDILFSTNNDNSPPKFDSELNNSLRFDPPMVTPTSTPRTSASSSGCCSSSSSNNNNQRNHILTDYKQGMANSNPLLMQPPLPPEFRFMVSARPPPGPPPLSPYQMLVPVKLAPYSLCSNTSLFPELPPIDMSAMPQICNTGTSPIKSEPRMMADSSSFAPQLQQHRRRRRRQQHRELQDQDDGLDQDQEQDQQQYHHHDVCMDTSSSNTNAPFSNTPSSNTSNTPSSNINIPSERKHNIRSSLSHIIPSRVVIPSRSYKKEIQRQSALQMEIQNIEQRRKKGTLCLGNFLFGCTADRPKVNTIRPFGRCDRCLAGRCVHLERTRMSRIKQFADEKRQTLIPGSHGQPPIRCQRYPNVFGNWALLVFATVQDAEEATRLLGEVNGQPSLVKTSSVLPRNVWANGVPFMRSGKYNKLVPKPIDDTSIVPPTKIIKPHLKPNELSRNIDDISKSWNILGEKFESLTAEQLASPAEMEDIDGSTPNTPTRPNIAQMYSLCDCGAPRCLHRFNPNSWVLSVSEDNEKPPIRWINYEDLHSDVSEIGPHYIIFSFPSFPGHSVQTEAYYVSSILSRRFEFRLPFPPEEVLNRQNSSLHANVVFRDSCKQQDIEVAPFLFIPPMGTLSNVPPENPFWASRTDDNTTKEETVNTSDAMET